MIFGNARPPIPWRFFIFLHYAKNGGCLKHIIGFLSRFFVCVFFVYGGFCGTAFACESNQIDVLGDGTQCELAKFSITTTNLSANNVFRFHMFASGTFYVDCGDDGTLTSDSSDVSNKTITRDNTNESIYTCSYTSGGIKTIQLGGLATGYGDYSYMTTISFSVVLTDTNPERIASISGDLSAMFPYISSNSAAGRQPRFGQLFFGASNLTNVPDTLFSNYTTAASLMFRHAFNSCSSLKTIPAGLFSSITTGTAQLFESTFNDCKNLETIPENLFSGIKNGAYGMFFYTFSGCKKLTSIPKFSNISSVGVRMFYGTFGGCTSLSGYIPPSMFAGLNGSGKYTTDMMTTIFSNTALATSCPTGTVQFITGYEQYWDGHVSCVDENLVCNSGEYFPAHWYECKTCPENNYCVGGTYPYSETVSAGATQCPHNGYSNTGASSVAQCYRILHVGNNELFLRGAKKTTPSLNIDINNDGVPDFFGNMTTADMPMNSGTARKLKVSFDGVAYSVYDDTVTVPE